jgi:hypothetical protein
MEQNEDFFTGIVAGADSREDHPDVGRRVAVKITLNGEVFYNEGDIGDASAWRMHPIFTNLDIEAMRGIMPEMGQPFFVMRAYFITYDDQTRIEPGKQNVVIRNVDHIQPWEYV